MTTTKELTDQLAATHQVIKDRSAKFAGLAGAFEEIEYGMGRVQALADRLHAELLNAQPKEREFDPEGDAFTEYLAHPAQAKIGAHGQHKERYGQNGPHPETTAEVHKLRVRAFRFHGGRFQFQPHTADRAGARAGMPDFGVHRAGVNRSGVAFGHGVVFTPLDPHGRGPVGVTVTGVIMAVAFILYGIVFRLDKVQRVFPPWLVHKLMALGVLIYAGTGIVSMVLGYNFLDYGAFTPHHPEHGQHWGILAVELGVGVTVTGVMVAIYYAFASRTPQISDEEW